MYAMEGSMLHMSASRIDFAGWVVGAVADWCKKLEHFK